MSIKPHCSVGILSEDRIVNELRRYNLKVDALQETKWFESEVYQVSSSVVLTAGRRTPGEGIE